jgi:hypothetical protein
MNADDFESLDEKKRKKRAVIAFEYFRWNVNQGVAYKLDESLDGEFLLIYCYNI